MKVNSEKFEKTLKNLLDSRTPRLVRTSCVIGKTDDKVIVLTVHSKEDFEDEFNDDFSAIPETHFSLESK